MAGDFVLSPLGSGHQLGTLWSKQAGSPDLPCLNSGSVTLSLDSA